MRKQTIFLLIVTIISSTKTECWYRRDHVQCQNMDSTELVFAINDFAMQHSVDFVDLIELNQITFESQSIRRFWLDGVHIKFSELDIIDTDLKRIEPLAFSGSHFSALETLRLEFDSIEFVASGAFDTLNISSLMIYNRDFYPITIERNALGSLSQTLSNLDVSNCLTHESLLNLTGPGTSLPFLKKFDAYVGQLGDLSAECFIGAPNLQGLYLDNSGITSIELGTFDSPILEGLDLGSNNLTSLPNHVFRYVYGGISIYGNPWQCDCELAWLKDLFHNFPTMFTHKSFTCKTESGWKDFEEVDFCPN